jgi:acyl carrier protein
MQCEDIREIRREVRDYVVSSFYVPGPETLADSASLIDTGIIDETGMLEMVAFLESTFGLEIDEREICAENLGSIARAAAFVCRKRAESAQPVDETADDAVDEVGMGDGGHVTDAVELDDLHAR